MTDDDPQGPWGGKFFAIEPEPWQRALALGMRPAIAYLMLARGVYALTGATSWSANSISERTLIRWDRAKAAIQDLVKAGLIRQDKGGKPRYTVLPAQQIAQESKPPAGNVVPIRERKAEAAASSAPENRIWLPNEIMGEGDRASPIEAIRISGDLNALRLFIDLYAHQDLPLFGGIDRAKLWMNFDRAKVGERGPYTVWAFTYRSTKAAYRPLAAPYMTGNLVKTTEWGERDEGWGRFFDALTILRQTRLVSNIPYLFDADADDAEAMHPVAFYGGGRTQEAELARLATGAGHALLTREASQAAGAKEAIVVPAKHHAKNITLVGILRTTYLPRTNKTAGWLDEPYGWQAWHDEYAGILQRYGGGMSAAG